MKPVLIELHFLPCLEYFCAWIDSPEVVLEKHENYLRQGLRNRCYVMTSQGPRRVTIPVVHPGPGKKVTDVRIDYTNRWQQTLWRTLTSAYAQAPFFEHYAGELKAKIFSNTPFLYDLNFELLSLCLRWVKLNVTIRESLTFEKHLTSDAIDLRNVISDRQAPDVRQFYRPHPYTQVFGREFVPNLSIVDLVFCEGPGAAGVLRNSRVRD